MSTNLTKKSSVLNMLYKILFSFILCVLIIAISILIYRSEFVYLGSQRYYFFNYIIFLLLIFFLNFFFYFKKKFYIFLIFLISAFALENFLFIYKFYTELEYKRFKIAKKNGSIFDRRNKLEVYNDLKKKNTNITIAQTPHIYINNSMKILNISINPITNSSGHKIVIHCNETGKWATYKSDRYGFNNQDNVWDYSEVDIALIGDSFILGACVTVEENIASQLSVISKKKIINGGVGGTGPLIQLAIFREYFLKKKPKKVFYFFFEGNDMDDLNYELTDPILKRYLDIEFSQNLILYKSDISNNFFFLATNDNKILDRFKFLTLRNFIMTIYRNFKYKNDIKKNNTAEFNLIIDILNKDIKSYNGKLYFVYLPKFSRYDTTSTDLNNELIFKKNEILNLIKKKNITVIDIDNAIFKKEISPKSFFNFELDGHYNANAYKKIAKYISKF